MMYKEYLIQPEAGVEKVKHSSNGIVIHTLAMRSDNKVPVPIWEGKQ